MAVGGGFFSVIYTQSTTVKFWKLETNLSLSQRLLFCKVLGLDLAWSQFYLSLLSLWSLTSPADVKLHEQETASAVFSNAKKRAWPRVNQFPPSCLWSCHSQESTLLCFSPSDLSFVIFVLCSGVPWPVRAVLSCHLIYTFKVKCFSLKSNQKKITDWYRDCNHRQEIVVIWKE